MPVTPLTLPVTLECQHCCPYNWSGWQHAHVPNTNEGVPRDDVVLVLQSACTQQSGLYLLYNQSYPMLVALADRIKASPLIAAPGGRTTVGASSICHQPPPLQHASAL